MHIYVYMFRKAWYLRYKKIICLLLFEMACGQSYTTCPGVTILCGNLDLGRVLSLGPSQLLMTCVTVKSIS